jgi:hypothetical protein
MKALFEILKQFDLKRDEIKKKEWDSNDIAECFFPCAKNVLLNGYFLINEKYIIDLGAIELYYHEEEGNIKDHIMYHTNEHTSKSRVFDLEGGFPYFKFGSLNLHQSGVDVTFENPQKRYRASFLIRAYRVLKKEEDLNNCQELYDGCSTHLFDDMFYDGVLSGDSSKIKWIKCNKIGNVIKCPRKNVAEYYIDDHKKIVKVIANINDKEYQTNKDRYLKVNGKYFKQDMRAWQFKIEGIKEK